mgnify:CR=1 FL=1
MKNIALEGGYAYLGWIGVNGSLLLANMVGLGSITAKSLAAAVTEWCGVAA